MNDWDKVLDAIEDEIDFGGSGLSRNPDAIRQRRWRERNAERQRLRWRIERQNQRARQMGCGGILTVTEWVLLLAKYGGHCLKCGKTENLQIDHVIPLEHGGLNSIENVQPLCEWCNKSKGTTHIDFRSGKGMKFAGGGAARNVKKAFI
jgi:5-methylcytosine-specific restriction endonuclease McrA